MEYLISSMTCIQIENIDYNQTINKIGQPTTSCIKYWGFGGYVKISAPHQLL